MSRKPYFSRSDEAWSEFFNFLGLLAVLGLLVGMIFWRS
jgi:hypothetical protein